MVVFLGFCCGVGFRVVQKLLIVRLIWFIWFMELEMASILSFIIAWVVPFFEIGLVCCRLLGVVARLEMGAPPAVLVLQRGDTFTVC